MAREHSTQNTRRRAGCLARLAGLATALACASVLAVYAAEVWGARRHPAAESLAYWPQHVYGALPLLALLLVILARRGRLLVPALAAIAFWAIALMRPAWHVPARPHQQPAGPTVRVVTYNVHVGLQGADRVAETVRGLQPDVICLQEAWHSPVLPLRRAFPGYHGLESMELDTLARFPIESHRRVPFAMGWRHGLETKLDVHGVPLTVLNVHFITGTHPSGSVERALRERTVREYLRLTVAARRAQVATVMRWLDEQRGPAIVVGDFNTPPGAWSLRPLRERMTDAFAAAGLGFGHTFPSEFPLIRIDYIWCTPDIRVRSCRVVRSAASDHCALVAELELPAGPRRAGGQRARSDQS